MSESESSPVPSQSGAGCTEGDGFSPGWRWQPPTPESLQGEISGYIVDGLIGRGGMGAVYSAHQESLSRRVAIKVLPKEAGGGDPGFSKRFRNEAQVMARVSHPSIVTVFDFGETDKGLLYFVMEFVEGINVLQKMDVSHGRRLSPSDAKEIALGVCDALVCAHAGGVIHRDIKPANVLVDSSGLVKVADFGLAKWVGFEAEGGLTRTGAVVGTPGYIAPEALLDEGTVDHRVDIYAVGAMLFQMLTGRPPQGWLQDPSGEIEDVSPDFDPVIRRAMDPVPECRYETAAALRLELESIDVFSDSKPSAASAETQRVDRSAGEDPKSGGKRSGWFWILWLVLFAGMVAAGMQVWSGSTDEAPSVEALEKLKDIPVQGQGALAPPSRRVDQETELLPTLVPPPRRVED